jgi:divalent metal cation (Fe/Co/Zn/Cd) transporter
MNGYWQIMDNVAVLMVKLFLGPLGFSRSLASDWVQVLSGQ